jgi:hypothetical protein
MVNLTTRTTCRLCPGELRTLLELAPTPPANALLRPNDIWAEANEEKYPLGLAQCVQCGHVQTPHVVDPSLLFTDDYAYVSGTSAVFRQHLSELARSVSAKLFPEDLIVEVGSNDGTLLNSFMTGRKLGVDPARRLAEKATKAGVLTYPGFLTPETAHAIVQAAGKARRVLALNVMAHVDDLRSMVEAIWGLLTDDGELVMEVAYLPDMLDQGYFDQIYSEHLSFHHLSPLVPFFASVGLTLYDAEHVAPQGGSIRCYVSKARREKTDRILGMLAAEKTRVTDEAFRKFRARIETNKTALRELLGAIKAQGKRIAAFGCPAKATTLLHEFGIGRETLEYVVEENPGKVGRFSPGKHIPIVSVEKFRADPPDYCLVTAWNFESDIRRRHSWFNGEWILPMPEVRVVE